MSAGADADLQTAFFRELHGGDDIAVSLRPHDDVGKAIRLAPVRNRTAPRVLVAGIVAPEDAAAHFFRLRQETWHSPRYQGMSCKLVKHRRQQLDKSMLSILPIWKFPVSIATLRNRTLSPVVEPCIECASEEAKSIVVVTLCIAGSCKSWGPLTAPTFMALTCRLEEPSTASTADLTGRAEPRRFCVYALPIGCCDNQKPPLTRARRPSHCHLKKVPARRTCRSAGHICSASRSPRPSAWVYDP